MEQNFEKFLIINEDCRIVRGASRSIVYDLFNNKYEYIPNTMEYILKNYNRKKIGSLYKKYKGQEDVLNSYFQFLVENDFIFIGDKHDVRYFNKLNLTWKSPYLISNAIIGANGESDKFLRAIKTLDEINCPHYFCFFHEKVSPEYLIYLCESIEQYAYKTIEFILPFNQDITHVFLENLVSKYPRIRSIVLSNAPFAYNNFEEERELGLIYFTKENIELSSDNMKDIHEYFTVNIDFFTEALQFNTYFNRKIYVSVDGGVSNYPEQSPFSNINDPAFNLINLLQLPEFTEMWHIHKGLVNICKDCEHRFMCFDNRIPQKDSIGSWSYESKCIYDPFTSTFNYNKTLR